MKAVIVELNKDRAAVLSDDGSIRAVKNKNYEIGQVIQIYGRTVSISKKLSVLAASAAVFILLGTGTWAYASPYTYVSVDVNPSIEFTVNRFDRVIKVKAVNDDGEEILKEISLDDLKNEKIENAIKSTVEQISDAGYFDGDIEGSIVIATSSENNEKADALADQLLETVTLQTADNGDNVTVEAFSVGMERVQEARELGVTPGKLNLVEKLQEAAGETAEVNIDEWLDKPVKEIMKATKEYKNNSKDADKESGQSNNEIPGDDAQEASGDAIAAEEPDQPQSQGKDTQMNDKAEQQTQNGEDKAIKDADKDADKAIKDADKEADKAIKDADKEADKAIKDTDKEADKAIKDADKETDKTIKDAEKEDKKADKSTRKEDKNGNKNSLTGGGYNNPGPTVTPAVQALDPSADNNNTKGESEKTEQSSKNNDKKNNEKDADINNSTDTGNSDINPVFNKGTKEDNQDQDSKDISGENNQVSDNNTEENITASDDKTEKDKQDSGVNANNGNQNNDDKSDISSPGSDSSNPGSAISGGNENSGNNENNGNGNNSGNNENNNSGNGKH